MEQNAKDIMAVYQERIFLYQDLLKCIDHERETLISQDINGIWTSLEEKQKILDSIERTKNNLGNFSGKDMGNFSREDREKIIRLSRTIIGLKQEIKARTKENISFINDTLEFFNELISTMTKTETDKLNSYGPTGNTRRGQRSSIYQGEV
jgi:hypothetical protein